MFHRFLQISHHDIPRFVQSKWIMTYNDVEWIMIIIIAISHISTDFLQTNIIMFLRLLRIFHHFPPHLPQAPHQQRQHRCCVHGGSAGRRDRQRRGVGGRGGRSEAVGSRWKIIQNHGKTIGKWWFFMGFHGGFMGFHKKTVGKR